MLRAAQVFMVVGIVAGSLAARAGDQQKRDPQLTVFVTDRAGVTTQLVADAERHAGRVFLQAGVDVDWVNCGGSPDASVDSRCGQPIPTGDLVISIVSRAQTLSDGIFGVSFVANDAGTYADVFFDPIRQLGELNREPSLAAILGDVMAHELGHLLLGSNAHTREGIMQPHWQPAQLHSIAKGQMRFTPEQASKMRTKIVFHPKSSQQTSLLEAARLEAASR
jgi:hypothetical protein